MVPIGVDAIRKLRMTIVTQHGAKWGRDAKIMRPKTRSQLARLEMDTALQIRKENSLPPYKFAWKGIYRTKSSALKASCNECR